MTNLTQLRLAAREIFEETVRAVDAGEAVRRAVIANEKRINICNHAVELGLRRVYAVAIGKAAASMAQALEQQLGESFVTCVMSGPLLKGTTLDSRWRCFEGGHPLPNQASILAAQDAISTLERANDERALVIFLISGGGSAMMEMPVREDISLEDLRAANATLVGCGASIAEINTVRRAFSAVKGGKLAAHAPNCEQITLIVSDVPAGEERNVASGPSMMPPLDHPEAQDIIAKYNLGDKLPVSVTKAVENEAELPALRSTPHEHFVLLTNLSALEAAARAAWARGFMTAIADDISDQPIVEGCAQLMTRLEALRSEHGDNPNPLCLLSGGEFACPVKGEGVGGRNLETALRLALSASSTSATMAALCAGTDGVDGNSPAAGAIVDNRTIARASQVGLKPHEFLDSSNSYSFFVALGDVIATGPTGTNVRDLRILLTTSS